MNRLLPSALAPLIDIAAIRAERARRDGIRARKLHQLFPEAGPHARELYPKQLEFFTAGADHKERLFMAANRVGKTVAGAYETALHLTGLYPDWWRGRRFAGPTSGWACGSTSQTTRDIVQHELLGPPTAAGTGVIPADLVVHRQTRRGLADAVELVWVRHAAGGTSVLGFKTYEQGRRSFEGTAQHFVWCDEEPPLDCYSEMLLRTLTTAGVQFTTFTPLEGMSEVVKSFLEPENDAQRAAKWWIQAGWRDVPHLGETEKTTIAAGIPLYQLKARTEGEPTLGAGAIYPIAESELAVDDFEPPLTWLRVFALDIGWNRTAVLWGALNPANDVVTLYDEHYQGQGEPASHAVAIAARGRWIPGVIDPASVGANQLDGRVYIDVYRALGLDLQPAINAVEAGITAVWGRMVSGRLKVQRHLGNWWREFRQYHRRENGKIVEGNDHLMDDTRYLVMSGLERASLAPVVDRTAPGGVRLIREPGGWMS